jgi:hypothetical protein
MNYEELEEAMDQLFEGRFSIETDAAGQLIVYTGLKRQEDDVEGELVIFDAEEDDELDPDREELDDEEVNLDDE